MAAARVPFNSSNTGGGRKQRKRRRGRSLLGVLMASTLGDEPPHHTLQSKPCWLMGSCCAVYLQRRPGGNRRPWWSHPRWIIIAFAPQKVVSSFLIFLKLANCSFIPLPADFCHQSADESLTPGLSFFQENVSLSTARWKENKTKQASFWLFHLLWFQILPPAESDVSRFRHFHNASLILRDLSFTLTVPPAKVTVPVSHWRPTSPPPCPSANSSQTARRRLCRTSPSGSGYLSRSALTVPLSLLTFNVAQNKLFAWLQMILNPIKR